MNIEKIVEWFASFFSIMGASLLSLNNPEISGYGFIFFLFANISWGYIAVVNNLKGLLFTKICFLATSIIGIMQWFF